MVDGSENEEGRLGREHRRALIECLNANDEYLQGIEGRRREIGNSPRRNSNWR